MLRTGPVLDMGHPRCHVSVPALRPDAHTATRPHLHVPHGLTARLTGLSVPPLQSQASQAVNPVINGSLIFGGISSNT